MEKKENIIRMWFNMWIDKKDYGIRKYFLKKQNILKAGDRNIMELAKYWSGFFNGIS